MLVAAVLVVAAVLREGGHDVLLLVIGAAALAVIAAGLVLRWSGALALGVALLGAQQATRLALGPDALDQATPLVAGALLLAAELAWWSIEPRAPAFAEPRVLVGRVAVVAGCCGLGALLAAFVVLAAGVPLEGGIALELVGVVAAAAAVAVVAAVARSSVR